jgi:hypothetical protein
MSSVARGNTKGSEGSAADAYQTGTYIESDTISKASDLVGY